MADIELVIKIPEDTFKKYQESVDCEERAIIVHGTPLPKGHGELKDADIIDDNIYDLTRSMDLDYSQIVSVLDNVSPIVEADKKTAKEEINKTDDDLER